MFLRTEEICLGKIKRKWMQDALMGLDKGEKLQQEKLGVLLQLKHLLFLLKAKQYEGL